MLTRGTTIAILTFLAACSGGADASAAGTATNPNAWVIGPLIEGENYSVGMPLHPSPGPGGTWYINLPRRPGSIHYVTFRHGSLRGKSRIVMRYRIEAAPGTRIEASTAPGTPGIITPFFQRAGDDWSASGRFETYRWYGTFVTQQLKRGEHQIVAPLNARWTAVQTSTAHSNPAAFRDAIAHADQVGFVLGGGDGYGHGAYATGPARLVVTSFSVE
jgi:hypothetical protein